MEGEEREREIKESDGEKGKGCGKEENKGPVTLFSLLLTIYNSTYKPNSIPKLYPQKI